MIEPVSGMPTPQFGNEGSELVPGSRFKVFLCFLLIHERCVRVVVVEDDCIRYK
jgi:hypothetical protein